VATECSWNDGSKTQYYYVILDQLPGRSGGLEWAPEWRVRGPLTLFVMELLWGQADVEGAGVQECTAIMTFSAEVWRRELGMHPSYY